MQDIFDQRQLFVFPPTDCGVPIWGSKAADLSPRFLRLADSISPSPVIHHRTFDGKQFGNVINDDENKRCRLLSHPLILVPFSDRVVPVWSTVNDAGAGIACVQSAFMW